jgi:endo-1,4-beta-xylanase
MTYYRISTWALAVGICFTSCLHKMEPSQSTASTPGKGLKDYYKDYFPIGVAVSPRDLKSSEAQLIEAQFNSLTPENAMKWALIHPEENRYNFQGADSIVAFAQEHHMKVRGHTLCRHNQVPGWLFKDGHGDTVTKEVLLSRLKDHITTVVNRYKGKVYAWDVVNEAVDDNDARVLRPSAWYRICGEDFLAKAFEYAHAADPNAVLFYNDYNTENPSKRERIYGLLKNLLAAGVPIQGIGLQGHWSINNPSREELEKSIALFSSLGLQVQITELDVSVYAGRQGGQLIQGKQDTAAVFTPEMEAKQLEKYQMIFEVFRRHKNELTGVTFWNVSDRYSWLDRRGHKNFPLLFDQNLKPKKAYGVVVNFTSTAHPPARHKP